MPRRQHQQGPLVAIGKRPKRLHNRLLLVLPCAPGNDHRLGCGLLQQRLQIVRQSGVSRLEVVLQVTAGLHALRRRPDRHQPLGILARLRQNQVRVPQHPCKEKSKTPIAAQRLVGNPRVDHHQPGARPLDLPEEIRPDLGLGDDHHARLQPGDHAANRKRQIERSIEDPVHQAREPLIRQPPPGGGADRHKNRRRRKPPLQRPNQPCARNHLAHRDGV